MKINLCESCKKELEHYNPYIDENGNPVSTNELEINIVPEEKCDNYTINGEFINLKER